MPFQEVVVSQKNVLFLLGRDYEKVSHSSKKLLLCLLPCSGSEIDGFHSIYSDYRHQIVFTAAHIKYG